MTTISTKEEFNALVARLEAAASYRRPAAYGIGLATIGPSGKILDTAFPVPNLGENFGTAAVVADALGHSSGSASYRLSSSQIDALLPRFDAFLADGQSHPNLDALRGCRRALDPSTPERRGGERVAVVTFIDDLATPPVDAHDVYLRLHLLSNRKIRPHGASLDGAFGLLTNVVWTDLGPFEVDGFDAVRWQLRCQGIEVRVNAIDKFPPMADYVVPTGVRLADADRARLGAHLGEGTTVMHEGFCNFNAGTLGAAMVEGRISAGVVVGEHSDLGGSASIMGTLSGGGKEVIKVGERCLVGANAGIGISLGDNCIVEAGCYVTAGSRVKLPDGSVIKAAELSGTSNVLFRRNSQSGAIEAIPNGENPNWGGLNTALHKN